jgi:ferredoxin-like protein FixX
MMESEKVFDCPPVGAASDCALCPTDVKRQCIPNGEITVTMEHCAECPAVSMCDAHITDGAWKHRKGQRHCKVVRENRSDSQIIDADETNSALVMVAKLRGRSA